MMSDFPTTSGVHSLLPGSPVRWLWTRLRVYLAVAAVVSVACIGVAAYRAIDPAERPAVWAVSTSSLSLIIIVSYGWRRLIEMHAFSRGLVGLLSSLSMILGLNGSHERRD